MTTPDKPLRVEIEVAHPQAAPYVASVPDSNDSLNVAGEGVPDGSRSRSRVIVAGTARGTTGVPVASSSKLAENSSRGPAPAAVRSTGPTVKRNASVTVVPPAASGEVPSSESRKSRAR